MFICPKCGKLYEKKFAFCAECGTRLEEQQSYQQEQQSYQQAQQPYQQAQQSYQQAQQSYQQVQQPCDRMTAMTSAPPVKKSKKWVAVLILVLLLFITAAVAVWYICFREEPDRQNKTGKSKVEADKDEQEDNTKAKDSAEQTELLAEDYVKLADSYFEDEESLDAYSADIYQIADGYGIAIWDIPDGLLTRVVDDFDGNGESECLAISYESGDIYATMYTFEDESLEEQSSILLGSEGNLAQCYAVVYLNRMKDGINISYEVEQFTSVEMVDGLNRIFVNATYKNGRLKKETDFDESGSDWYGVLTPDVEEWNLSTDVYYYEDMIYNANKDRAIAICEISGKVDSSYLNDYNAIAEFVEADNGAKKKCGTRIITDGAPKGYINLERKKNSAPVTATRPPEETTPPVANAFVIADSSTRYLTEADLEGLTKEELRIARNEIYARNGRIFQDAQLQEYFEEKGWYLGTIPADEFTQDMLSDVERANAALISEYEKKLQ